ncbi:Uncharacterised protein [Pseudomonas aeruginosa]|nr:Uncharacterised protein [Pseudomonas aeruginosa]CRR08064.1 hypothetical protein PAERUG_E5_London_17_VIM_2_12_12_05881 [Pseudomonas aeruginosa]CRS22087.1 hypothetical protein PAERUG_P48_London_17_VIM_2_01_13_05712 [Pseudomonas aeruginosa]
MEAMIRPSCSCSSVRLAARDSMSRAQAPAERLFTHSGMPCMFSTERRLRRSSSSTAETGWRLSTATAVQQVSTVGKTSSAEALCGCSGTVS